MPEFGYVRHAIHKSALSADPASRARTRIVSLGHKPEAEVKRWVTLVALRVGRVALEKIAGMDQSHW